MKSFSWNRNKKWNLTQNYGHDCIKKKNYGHKKENQKHGVYASNQESWFRSGHTQRERERDGLCDLGLAKKKKNERNH